MGSSLAGLVADFEAHPMASARAMRELVDGDVQRFLAESRPLLAGAPETPGFDHLLSLIQSHGLILETICDPSLFTVQQSILLAKRLARRDPHLDVCLAKFLAPGGQRSRTSSLERSVQSPVGQRLLEMISAISDASQSLLITGLTHHPDARIRSKAALLIAKSNKNASWVESRSHEKDPRVRANALEALWGGESAKCRELFRASVCDADNRVSGNAVLGLYLLGDPSAIPLIREMIQRPEIDFQQTALWVIGQTGDPRFAPLLERMLAAPPPNLRAHIYQAVIRLKKRRNQLGALPALKLVTLAQVELAEGWKEIGLNAQSSEGANLAQLKPTQFVLWEGGEPVDDYDVRTFHAAHSLWLGFAFPQACQEAYSNSKQHRRKIDKWLTGEPGADPWQATASLVSKALAAAGTWQIVVVDDGVSAPMEPAEIEAIQGRARGANVCVHGIGIQNQVLRQFCLGTGGKYLAARNAEHLPELLESLSQHLVATYALRYRSLAVADGPVDLKIEVYAEQGCGETSLA
jgi:hypothetical protein